ARVADELEHVVGAGLDLLTSPAGQQTHRLRRDALVRGYLVTQQRGLSHVCAVGLSLQRVGGPVGLRLLRLLDLGQLLRSVRVRLGLGAVLRGLLAELLHVVRVEGLRVPLVTLLLVRLFALLGRVLDLIGHLAASWASGTRHRGGWAPTVG